MKLGGMLVAWAGAMALGALAEQPPANAEPQARSSVVYPAGDWALRVNHAEPAHARLACTRCHVRAEASGRAADRLVPPERTCLPCHQEQIERSASASACRTCHPGYRPSRSRMMPASEPIAARVHFSHARHAAADVACEQCHEGLGTAPSRAHLPSMKQCLGCHRRRADAGTECRTCHLSQPDGRLVTRFPEGWLNPPQWLFGMRHDADWIVRHRWVAADRGDTCTACHREQECVDCHDGKVRPPSIHPNDYLTIHPQQAQRDQPRCRSCHSPQTFCAECHARLGVSLTSAPDVRAAGRFHPPAEVWLRGPTLHGREAQRSLDACVSCHAERDCLTCHAAAGIGVGISPHPPGFLERCANLREINGRACARCHTDVDAVAARCR